MFKVCKFSLYDSKNTIDLCDGEDEQPDLSCTLQPQRWHKTGRGDKICINKSEDHEGPRIF